MNGAALIAVADALADAGVPSLRFNYPYRSSGKKAPDRPKVLDAATREAAAELARRAKLAPDRLVLGGRSMGGRYCSLVVGADDDPVPALGLLLLGYPLHAAGKPEQPRVEHFARLRVPVLFASGTRDSLAGQSRPHESRAPHQGEGVVPLDRDRRPRLPAPEVQRAHQLPTCSRRWRRLAPTGSGYCHVDAGGASGVQWWHATASAAAHRCGGNRMSGPVARTSRADRASPAAARPAARSAPGVQRRV